MESLSAASDNAVAPVMALLSLPLAAAPATVASVGEPAGPSRLSAVAPMAAVIAGDLLE
ncbi:hypothetical protein [Nitrobacter sp. TKz-YC01]|uniref:hypothetical protein n=1 Tax=Nitrobacter sp. TKz-YC01 TaxID=3398703 RepID=UPI003A0FE002